MGHLQNSIACESPAMPLPQEQNVNRLMQGMLGPGIVAILALVHPHAAAAQGSTARDGQHDFDFNIGVWHTPISRVRHTFANPADTVVLDGTVTVRKVWGGKAELEEIEADGATGHWEGLTLFLYNPTAHQWTQSFANSRAGTLTSNIGGFQEGRVVLAGQDN